MSSDMLVIIWQSLLETLAMVAISGGVGALLGVPLGVVLFITDRKSFVPMPAFNAVLGTVINALRSVPFIILLVAIIPFTRLVVGTSIGTAAAVVPLTLAVAPFIARIVETSLREVDKGLIEAAQSMGATNLQIVTKILLPEAMPGIVSGLTISIIALIGYSAMAGAIGGGRPRRPRHPLRLSALHARSHVDGRSHPDRSRAGHPDDRRLDRPQDQPQVSFLARPAPQSGAAVLHFVISAGGCSSMAEQ